MIHPKPARAPVTAESRMVQMLAQLAEWQSARRQARKCACGELSVMGFEFCDKDQCEYEFYDRTGVPWDAHVHQGGE